jgi:hypothetical protein
MLTQKQIANLRHLRRELTAEAPVGEEPLRLVAGGFRNRDAAHAAMLEQYLPLMGEVATQRFGLLVRPMARPAPGGRRISGWGVYIRDRAATA